MLHFPGSPARVFWLKPLNWSSPLHSVLFAELYGGPGDRVTAGSEAAIPFRRLQTVAESVSLIVKLGIAFGINHNRAIDGKS